MEEELKKLLLQQSPLHTTWGCNGDDNIVDHKGTQGHHSLGTLCSADW